MGIDTNALPAEKRPFAFIDALLNLQQECGVADLKMSDYGIGEADFPKLIQNARHAMGGLFNLDPVQLSDADVLQIFYQSYK